MLYIHKNGELPHLKKDGRVVACSHMDDPLGHYAEVNSHKKTNTDDSIYYTKSLRVVKFIGTGSRMVVARGGGGGWSYRFVGRKLQFCTMKEFCRWTVMMFAQKCQYT